jgi:hypothetical protein
MMFGAMNEHIVTVVVLRVNSVRMLCKQQSLLICVCATIVHVCTCGEGRNCVR